MRESSAIGGFHSAEGGDSDPDSDGSVPDERLPLISVRDLHDESTAGRARQSGTDPDIAGVVLAAGRSTRFGPRDKLTEDIDGSPVVRHVVRTLVDAELDQVVVVVPDVAGAVANAISELPVEVTSTPESPSTLSSSLRTGLDSLPEDIDGVLVALGDMPAVSTETIGLLVDTFRCGDYSAIAAGYDGTRGNPVLFDVCHFDRLRAITGDHGGRAILFEADDAVILETDDPGVVHDVDTPADLETVAAVRRDGPDWSG